MSGEDVCAEGSRSWRDDVDPSRMNVAHEMYRRASARGDTRPWEAAVEVLIGSQLTTTARAQHQAEGASATWRHEAEAARAWAECQETEHRQRTADMSRRLAAVLQLVNWSVRRKTVSVDDVRAAIELQ